MVDDDGINNNTNDDGDNINNEDLSPTNIYQANI